MNLYKHHMCINIYLLHNLKLAIIHKDRFGNRIKGKILLKIGVFLLFTLKCNTSLISGELYFSDSRSINNQWSNTFGRTDRTQRERNMAKKRGRRRGISVRKGSLRRETTSEWNLSSISSQWRMFSILF